MTKPLLRLAINRLVEIAWEESARGLECVGLRSIARLPKELQRVVDQCDDAEFTRLFTRAAAKRIMSEHRGQLPN
jgi:hypothetical protein